MSDSEQTKLLAFAPNKGIVVGNDNTHHAYLCRRHHDLAITGLWLVSLHDGKRGTCQISHGTSLLARQRTLLG
jgi:hypothetical protein